MEPGATRIDEDALLPHAGWLRALAASLVADPATADDLVQDTWVAALEHPPRAEVRIEPWLARVLRNFAFKRRRGEARRAMHETASAGSIEGLTPDQTVEKLDLHSKVVDAVRATSEPFRTTIVLRYFEGRSSAEIARMQGIPAGTVRWRLKRGLDELRERLDQRFDGSRATWLGLLAPLVSADFAARGGSGAAAPTNVAWKGVLVMNASQAALTFAALVAVAGIVWWSFDEAGEPTFGPSAAVASELEPASALDGASSTAALDEAATTDASDRESALAVVGEAAPQVVSSSMDVGYMGAVDARFVDELGSPRSGVRFAVCEDRREVVGVPPVFSGADGRARLELPIPRVRVGKRSADKEELMQEWRFRFSAALAGRATAERAATVRSGETAHLGDVILGPGVRVHGRVVGVDGRGIPAATVGVAGVELSENEGRMRRHGAKAFTDAWTVTSSDDGTFVLDGVAVGAARLWSKADGMRYSWSAPVTVAPDRDVYDVELVLTPMLATDRIAGRVIDPEGNPVPHASLFHVSRAGEHSKGAGLSAGESGQFELVIEYDGATYDFTASDWQQRFAQASALGVVPGTLDLVLRLEAKQFLDVHVTDSDGRAVDGVRFNVGSHYYHREAKAKVVSAARYRVEVPDDISDFEISAPGWRTEQRGPLDPRSMVQPLEVVLRRAPVVRGRVIADGRALAGVNIEARAHYPDGSQTVNGFRCVMSSWSSGSATTGADGSFDLICDLDDALWIRATADGWAAGELGPIEVARLGSESTFDVVLTKGGAIEGHVLLAGGSDAEGSIVAINHGDGLPRTTRAGPNGLFRFDGLSPGRWQVIAHGTEIDPGSTLYSSTDDTEPIEWSCEVVAGSTTRYDLDLTGK